MRSEQQGSAKVYLLLSFGTAEAFFVEKALTAIL